MESFAATLNINGSTKTVTILGVDVEFPDVLISYIDENGNLGTTLSNYGYTLFTSAYALSDNSGSSTIYAFQPVIEVI